MNEQKSFLTYFAEMIEQYRADQRQKQVATAETTTHKPNKLFRLAGWLLPNGGTLLIVLLLIATQSLWSAPLSSPSATSTSTISYQGRLADAGGEPLTGLYNMEFRIYDVPTGGALLWEEFWTGGHSVQVSDGLFNVMLGSVDNTLANAIAGHDELYLGITVGTDSEMSPRVQLGSVPYSFQAQEALTVSDGSITAAKIADGAVTRTKLNLDDGLDVSGSTTLDYNQGNIPGQALVVQSGADQLKIVDVGDGDYLMLGHHGNSGYLSDYTAGGGVGASIHLNHDGSITMTGPATFQTWEQVTATGDFSATASCPSGKSILFGWKLHLTTDGQPSRNWGSCTADATSCSINASDTPGDDEVRIWIVCQ